MTDRDPLELHPIAVHTPAESSRDDLHAFIDVVAKGGEVLTRDIARGVARARYLLWIPSDGLPIAVAALKSPYGTYRKKVQEKSGVALPAAKFPYEFGYAYTESAHRRRGHGRRLLRKALELAAPSGVYATVRANNQAMRALLEEIGFGTSGREYESENRNARLVTYVTQGN